MDDAVSTRLQRAGWTLPPVERTEQPVDDRSQQRVSVAAHGGDSDRWPWCLCIVQVLCQTVMMSDNVQNLDLMTDDWYDHGEAARKMKSAVLDGVDVCGVTRTVCVGCAFPGGHPEGFSHAIAYYRLHTKSPGRHKDLSGQNQKAMAWF